MCTGQQHLGAFLSIHQAEAGDLTQAKAEVAKSMRLILPWYIPIEWDSVSVCGHDGIVKLR